ncbi:LysM peptidoglycan-binding domain-containing protein [Solitalea lacus]|uniref:LysM peptidoglycan-binding domain-containing protein n=1 Tax=Solitalea lacus TaxID=2911172 RepID=UPI001EDC8E1C|nr:LysM peptidoglycan-binding domain-containing protein [Solitalea lacus]UKJ05987.1 LysM peptidoglycan-binding domain-containing protein [Solitalea lacus]
MKRFGLLLFTVLGASSLAKASTIDSLGIGEFKGKPVILHIIESKENYYSISRKYHVSPSELMEFNDKAPIRIGDTLKVYKKNLALKKSNTTVVGGKSIEHTVTTGETMFSISRKYGVAVEDILTLNNLSSNSVKIGQKLKIIPGSKGTLTASTAAKPVDTPVKVEKQEEVKPVMKPAAVKVETKEEATVVENTESVSPVSQPGKVGKEIHETGLATWINDNDLNQAKSVALHRSAPIGTIIKITNPMTNKSGYVKVVGNFPESSDTKNVLIVISKSAASTLGVRDQKFRIELSYAL